MKLLPDTCINVAYFNSKGKVGRSYKDVTLSASRCSMRWDATSTPGVYKSTRGNEESSQSTVSSLPKLDCHTSFSATKTLSYEWHWVDVIGRDPEAIEYARLCRKLTETFELCSSLLCDREHQLLLPQFIHAASNQHQHLVVLRVATPKINLTADSVIELSNRWLLVVDTNRKLIITLHRVDTDSMAYLRTHWARLMDQTVAFEEFLLKVLDDAVATYDSSLELYEKILDFCEAKLLDPQAHATSQNAHPFVGLMQRQHKQQVMDHFENASSSNIIGSLLKMGKPNADTAEINSFIYHMHRGSNVQHRILSTTAPVLRKCFTEFHVCSKDRSGQMCGHINDLAGKALEVRDNAKNLLELRISLVSFRTNELMAILTRFSIYFVPLSFIASVYGMNFFIPEIQWRYGYLYFWLVAVAFCIIARLTVLRRHS